MLSRDQTLAEHGHENISLKMGEDARCRCDKEIVYRDEGPLMERGAMRGIKNRVMPAKKW